MRGFLATMLAYRVASLMAATCVAAVVILAAAAWALRLDAPHEPAAVEAVEARRLALRLLGGQKASSSVSKQVKK